MTLTQWFDAHIRPQYVGVYQRKYCEGVTSYCYWDGQSWYSWGSLPSIAIAWYERKDYSFILAEWRGVAVEWKE